MSKQSRNRTRAGIAGVVGAVVAFGITELAHGLYVPVPSTLVSLAQRVVELTPGTIVTRGIELLGTADIPTLIASVLIVTVILAFLLGNLAVRRSSLALLGVAALGALSVAAALADPFVEAFPTVVTIVVALLAGSAVTEVLLRAAGFRPNPEPRGGAPPGGRAGRPALARRQVARSRPRRGNSRRTWRLSLARWRRRRSRPPRGRYRAPAGRWGPEHRGRAQKAELAENA